MYFEVTYILYYISKRIVLFLTWLMIECAPLLGIS